MNPVFNQRFGGSVHQWCVQRRVEYLLRILDVGFEAFKGLEPIAGTFGIIVNPVRQTCDADITRQGTHLANVGNPFASFAQRSDTGPAGQRNQHRQHDDQSKPKR
ncbi:hypothetical protein ALP64_203479 [Pseudomonas syringae pv. actinidiae]|nr:hypothetical protein ALP64_203479 [Pseudomonas syringae pv. actinidiae]